MVDTGMDTMTGGRIKRIQKYVGYEQFLLTYGDAVTDLNIEESIRVHKKSGAILSLMAYKPIGKFGLLQINEQTGYVDSFLEKPDGDGNWVNAGYFVCEPEVFDYIPSNDDTCVFERQPLERISAEGKMHAFRHTGFWKPMDILRDSNELNEMWNKGEALWKIW